MANQMIFKRYEFKYLLTDQQKQRILAAMMPYMRTDQFGQSTIRNIYYDTDNFQLIRASLEKPIYKEKLRIRSYHCLTPEENAFVELKKKYRSVVYKRRESVPLPFVQNYLANGISLPGDSQIIQEINYFVSFYDTLAPRVFLSYNREAYYEKNNPDFRVTFDSNILCREDDLSLCSEAYGTSLLPEGTTLMEIKAAGAIPLWMTALLTTERLYRTTFSKYGTCYRNLIFPKSKGVFLYV